MASLSILVSAGILLSAVGFAQPILTARAAAAFGLRYTLSTMSICSLEDIAEHVGQPFWFQLYVMRDRAFIEQLIERAKAAGVDALVLTLDLQILGQRHKDLINGLSAPPKLTLPNLLNMATKPRWVMGMLGTKRRGFGNIVGLSRRRPSSLTPNAVSFISRKLPRSLWSAQCC